MFRACSPPRKKTLRPRGACCSTHCGTADTYWVFHTTEISRMCSPRPLCVDNLSRVGRAGRSSPFLHLTAAWEAPPVQFEPRLVVAAALVAPAAGLPLPAGP